MDTLKNKLSGSLFRFKRALFIVQYFLSNAYDAHIFRHIFLFKNSTFKNIQLLVSRQTTRACLMLHHKHLVPHQVPHLMLLIPCVTWGVAWWCRTKHEILAEHQTNIIMFFFKIILPHFPTLIKLLASLFLVSHGRNRTTRFYNFIISAAYCTLITVDCQSTFPV